jgi:hypothetical protein
VAFFFEYDQAFITTGHELSPLNLPLVRGVRARDTVPTLRLPGLFEDALPDPWVFIGDQELRLRCCSLPACEKIVQKWARNR